jgi:hypothetical protein
MLHFLRQERPRAGTAAAFDAKRRLDAGAGAVGVRRAPPQAARRALRGSAAATIAALLLFAPVAGCGSASAVTFSPVSGATSVVVHNARGIFRPETIRDASTVRRLVEIMNRYNDGWSTKTKSSFGTVEPPTCAYGIGFYDKGRWLGGVSIETDGATVARSQLGTTIVYKYNTRIGNEMLAALRRPLRSL